MVSPEPAEVSCGEILVQSTVVTNDLLDCPGHGLIVGTGGITIDLDGHLNVLPGLGVPEFGSSDRAERMADLFDDFADVRLPDADRNEVRIGDLWANQPVVFVWLRHYG